MADTLLGPSVFRFEAALAGVDVAFAKEPEGVVAVVVLKGVVAVAELDAADMAGYGGVVILSIGGGDVIAVDVGDGIKFPSESRGVVLLLRVVVVIPVLAVEVLLVASVQVLLEVSMVVVGK